MRKVSQSGYSLLVNLGFLAMFLFALGLSSYWISLYKHQKGIVFVVNEVAQFYQAYQNKAPEMLRNRFSVHAPIYLKSYELLPSCVEEESFFDKNKKVCQSPLGEIDIEVDYVYPSSYTYVYVHFTDIYKRHSCEQFLSAEWEKIVPEKWWGNQGYIGVISERTPGKMYFSYNQDYIERDGAQREPTKEFRHQICKVCKKSRYCSVLMFFVLNENIFKNSENAVAIQN